MSLKSKLKEIVGNGATIPKLVGALLILTAGLLYFNNKSVTAETVMITNMAGNSGGSGVVIELEDTSSTILTNAHVCGVVLKGGMVQTTYGESAVVEKYAKDTVHDLCVIKVSKRLKQKAKLASGPPKLYSKSTVSGHPSLYPNIVTQGHFSGRSVINVFTGTRECTDKDTETMDGILVCAFFNGMPVFNTYEAGVISALIKPGSSGSAVYNEDNELSGLVFAGAGEIGYGMIVPYEYVANFISKVKDDKVKYISPQYEQTLLDMLSEKSTKSSYKSLIKKCDNAKTKAIKILCDKLQESYVR